MVDLKLVLAFVMVVVIGAQAFDPVLEAGTQNYQIFIIFSVKPLLYDKTQKLKCFSIGSLEQVVQAHFALI